MSTVLRIAALTFSFGAAGAAFADDLMVPAQYPTVETAQTAAHAFDRIVVRGRVAGDATISVDGVAVDLSRARIDGGLIIEASDATVVGGDLRGGLQVHGDRVYVRGARLRGTAQWDPRSQRRDWPGFGAAAMVWIVGDDATLDGVRIAVSAGATGVNARADRTVLRGCVVRGGQIGADLKGDAVAVSGGRFETSEMGICAASDGAKVSRNVVRTGRSGSAVTVTGADVVVADNFVRGGAGGLTVYGAAPTVRGNDVAGTTEIGINAWSDTGGLTVTKNRVRASRGLGIDARSPGAVVDGNQVRSPGDSASLRVIGDAGSVRHNAVVRTQKRLGQWAASDGILARGGNLLVDGNSVVEPAGDVSRGLFVDGVGNVVTGNDVTGGGTGITVCGCAGTLTANSVRGVSQEGVVVAGEGTTVTNAVVDGASGAGILLFTPVDVTGGSVSHCSMAGIVAIGDGCSLAGCTLSNNGRVDVVTNGDISVATSGLAPNVRIVTVPADVPRLLDRIGEGPVRVGVFPDGND